MSSLEVEPQDLGMDWYWRQREAEAALPWRGEEVRAGGGGRAGRRKGN